MFRPQHSLVLLEMIGTRASLDLDLRCQTRNCGSRGNMVLKFEQKKKKKVRA